MLTCQDLTELVTDYLERRLTVWDRIRFHMHLGMCVHCRSYVRAQKMTILAVGEIPPESVPDDVRDELLKRFADWKKG